MLRPLAILGITAVIFISAACGPEKLDLPPGQETQPPAPRLQAVPALGVPPFTGKLTVYHSKGHQRRAKELAGLLEQAMRFFEDRRKVAADLSLAVLPPADWERVEKSPYGLPSVSPP